jgi:integrase/recombinase XerD
MTGEQSELVRQIGDYLDHLAVERALSVNTLDSYRRDLRRYLDFCDRRHRTSAAQVIEQDVTEFARELAAGTEPHQALARASVSRTLSAVRGLHRFLLLEGVTESDPATDVRPTAPSRRLPKALPVATVLAILDAPPAQEPVGQRDRALLEVLYATGARISEAVGLDVDDLDLASGVALLRGKGGKSRLVPVGSHAKAAVSAYLVRSRPVLAVKGTGSSALFLNQQGRRLSRQSSWNVLRSAAQTAQVTEVVSPHVLRHSFATHLLDGGADVRVVQELLGHASVTTTQIYTLVTVDKLREVYVSTHPRALC